MDALRAPSGQVPCGSHHGFHLTRRGMSTAPSLASDCPRLSRFRILRHGPCAERRSAMEFRGFACRAHPVHCGHRGRLDRANVDIHVSWVCWVEGCVVGVNTEEHRCCPRGYWIEREAHICHVNVPQKAKGRCVTQTALQRQASTSSDLARNTSTELTQDPRPAGSRLKSHKTHGRLGRADVTEEGSEPRLISDTLRTMQAYLLHMAREWPDSSG